MLKQRLIPILYLKNGYLVRSEKFKFHQNLGNPVAQVERFNSWNVDELVYLDISPEGGYDSGRDDQKIQLKDLLGILKETAKRSFMPLTFGGGIRTLDQIQERLYLGADKVCINSIALEDPAFIDRACQKFGAQTMVVSIDAKLTENGRYEVYCWRKQTTTGQLVEEWAREVSLRGPGEILINSVDRDGTGEGYDMELVNKVIQSTNTPLVICGGVGDYSHFVTGIRSGVSAIGAGNIFNFKEMSYLYAKKELKKLGLNVR